MQLAPGVFFDNTRSVKKLAKRGVPAIPKGQQELRFEVGQTVYHTGAGVYKRGTPCRIVDRYIQHGYAYYVDETGKAHRDRDIMAEKAA